MLIKIHFAWCLPFQCSLSIPTPLHQLASVYASRSPHLSCFLATTKHKEFFFSLLVELKERKWNWNNRKVWGDNKKRQRNEVYRNFYTKKCLLTQIAQCIGGKERIAWRQNACPTTFRSNSNLLSRDRLGYSLRE